MISQIITKAVNLNIRSMDGDLSTSGHITTPYSQGNDMMSPLSRPSSPSGQYHDQNNGDNVSLQVVCLPSRSAV